jgi:hypothetical protein
MFCIAADPQLPLQLMFLSKIALSNKSFITKIWGEVKKTQTQNPKSQITNLKQIPNSKLQFPKLKKYVWNLELWSLELICYLVLGAWNLIDHCLPTIVISILKREITIYFSKRLNEGGMLDAWNLTIKKPF